MPSTFLLSPQLMKVVSFNLGMSLPLGLSAWHCRYKQCMNTDVYRVPSLYATLGYLLAAALCHDVIFYHAHRLVR